MFQVFSDSACDLSKSYVEKHNINIIPIYITYDGKTYLKDGIETQRDEFYRMQVEKGLFPQTSLPTVDDYRKAFEPYVKNGIPIICACISTSLSGSYNSAAAAKTVLTEKYPDAKITVIDSKQNTASQALVTGEIARMNEDGVPYEEAVSKLNALCNSGIIFFTVGSFEYLQKGGRIGKLAAVATDAFSIKPVIVMKNGEIGCGGLGRNRKKLLKSVIGQLKKHIDNSGQPKEAFRINVGIGYDKEEGEQFMCDVQDATGIKCDTELNVLIGPVSACHTGPYALGTAVVRKYETL